MLDMQKRYGIPVDRVSQAFANSIDIQHRVPAGQHACPLSGEITDEVPQCPPGANVASAVGELIETIDCHLNRTASNERFQLLLDEAGAEAGKGASDAVAQRGQHLSAALDVKKQGRSRFVRRWRRSTSNDTFNQMTLADPSDAVHDEDAEPVFRLFQSLTDAVERQIGQFLTALDIARVRQEIFEVPGCRVGEVSGEVQLGTG